jgi:hypothetical protein
VAAAFGVPAVTGSKASPLRTEYYFTAKNYENDGNVIGMNEELLYRQ